MTAIHCAALEATEPTDFDHEALVDNDFGIFSKILWAVSSIFNYSPIAYSSTARIAVYLTQQDMEKRSERS